jgi:O-antigen/teichoic acid export membrane protein
MRKSSESLSWSSASVTPPSPCYPNRRRAAAWGIFFSYGGAILTVARNIVLVPFYLHFVSLAEYGAWLATGATILQLLVSDFGLAGVLMQRSAALHGAGESTRLGVLMGSGMVAGLLLATVSLAIGAAVIPLLPQMSGLAPAESTTVTHCLYLAVFAGALGIIAAIAQGLVRSLQRGAAAGAIALAAEVLNIALSAILLFSGAGLYALVWGMIARSLLVATASTLCLLWVCGRELTFAATRSEVRSLFADTGTSLIAALAMKSLTQLNTLLVGVVLGPTSAAAYGLTVRAHETLSVFLGQMNAAFAPGMAHLWGSGNTARFRVLLSHLVSGSALLAGLGAIAVICANASFVNLWVHRGVFGGQTTSILMGLAVWISQIGYVGYDALYALGKFKVIARTFVAAAVLHVTLLACLLRLGIEVVPLVTLLTSSVWGAVFWRRVGMEAQLSRADRNVTLADLVTIACCGTLVAGICLSLYAAPDSWDGLIIRAACCVLAMFATVLLVNGRIRGIVQGEIRMTVRSMLARHGA